MTTFSLGRRAMSKKDTKGTPVFHRQLPTTILLHRASITTAPAVHPRTNISTASTIAPTSVFSRPDLLQELTAGFSPPPFSSFDKPHPAQNSSSLLQVCPRLQNRTPASVLPPFSSSYPPSSVFLSQLLRKYSSCMALYFLIGLPSY